MWYDEYKNHKLIENSFIDINGMLYPHYQKIRKSRFNTTVVFLNYYYNGWKYAITNQLRVIDIKQAKQKYPEYFI